MLSANLITVARYRLREFLGKPGLLKNTSWMLAAEGMSRTSRLVTIFVLALCLDTSQYGSAMLAIICHDMFRVFTRVGSGAKVIQSSNQELASFASNAITLQWLLCLCLSAIQIASAESIARYYGDPELVLPLQIMALSNLLYPLVAVRVFMVQRANRMKCYSMAIAISVVVENLSTSIFALMGLGVVSVALAKLCSACCWVIIFSRIETCSFPAKFCLQTMRQLTLFSGKILASELLKSLRINIDSLFAARILSPELFGLYSFAKSSGIGLSLSLSNGYLSSLYPYLCNQLRSGFSTRLFRKAYFISGLISLIFLIQAAAAPLYLDLIFGSRWQNATLLVSILCLSAIPALYIDTAATIFRAQDRAHWEFYLSLYSVLTLAVSILLIQPQTTTGIALLVTLTSLLWLPAVLLPNKVQRKANNP